MAALVKRQRRLVQDAVGNDFGAIQQRCYMTMVAQIVGASSENRNERGRFDDLWLLGGVDVDDFVQLDLFGNCRNETCRCDRMDGVGANRPVIQDAGFEIDVVGMKFLNRRFSGIGIQYAVNFKKEMAADQAVTQIFDGNGLRQKMVLRGFHIALKLRGNDGKHPVGIEQRKVKIAEVGDVANGKRAVWR